jgi:hypothetical protein
MNEPAETGEWIMKTSGTNHFMLRLALLIAPFAVVDRANAMCAPTSPTIKL